MEKRCFGSVLFLVFTLTILLIISGCEMQDGATQSFDSTGSGAVGVKLLRYSVNGFAATASCGAASIKIDLQRTIRNDVDISQYPEMDGSPYISNFVVFNRSGYPFVIVGDGMLPMDDKTGQVDIDPPKTIDHENQLDDLELVADAVRILRSNHLIGLEFAVELDKIANATNSAIENADAVLDGRIAPSPETTGGQPKGSTYIQNFFVKKKSIAGSDLAEHSAIKIDVYSSSGTYIGYLSTRNHGTEADDSSMTTVSGCPRAFYNRSTTLPPIQPYVSIDTFAYGDAGGCPTSYGLVGSGVHVCNDDSLAMLHMAINNAPIVNDPTCTDSTLKRYAPSCY